ncbi:MAG: glycosyltransferase family 4 protein [Planctomycetes bacterium]|nr:glycosyltransferase family 4 protein [Planctomycetota bacterium]
MKVLVANDLYSLSSAGGVAVRMAQGLAARGHEVSFLATVQKADQVVHERRDGVDVRLVHTPPYALRWRAWKSLDNPPGTAAMAAAVDDLRPDVVHVHNLHIHLGYACLAAARRAGAKVVLTVHDVMPFCHQKLFCHLDERLVPGDDVPYRSGTLKCAVCVKGRFNPFRNGRIRTVLGRDVDALVAVSDEMGKALLRNGIGPARTIANGIPPEVEDVPAERVRAFREAHGLLGRRIVFYGGRLDRLKGGLELVRALELVRRSVPEATLVTVGEALPGFVEEMGSLARRLGLPDDALVSVGWLSGDELATAYAAADVVASPSLCFESFGLVNLEAMRAGRPVVASMWGGPSDVIEDGVSGFLVNPLQVGVLAERLLRVLRDDELALRLGRAARRRVAERFALDDQIDRVEDLYRELLA